MQIKAAVGYFSPTRLAEIKCLTTPSKGKPRRKRRLGLSVRV